MSDQEQEADAAAVVTAMLGGWRDRSGDIEHFVDSRGLVVGMIRSAEGKVWLATHTGMSVGEWKPLWSRQDAINYVEAYAARCGIR